MVASQFIGQGHETKRILGLLQIPGSSWYYRSTGGRQGPRPSTHTRTLDGRLLPNQEIIRRIEVLLQQDFVDYGYIKVTHWLRQNQNVIINFKKVYRLMRENTLLYHQHRRDKKGKTFIKFRVPKPELPFEHMEVDIKYIWVHGSRRMAYLLSVIDIKTRAVLGWMLQHSIRKNDVVSLVRAIAAWYCLPTKVTVRSDNGAQFEAKMVRECLSEMEIQQEFSHVATPQDNGHIESYHSIIKKAVCNVYEFFDLREANEIIRRFVCFYNQERLHSGIGYLSPNEYFFKLGLNMPPHYHEKDVKVDYSKNVNLYQFVESVSKK